MYGSREKHQKNFWNAVSSGVGMSAIVGKKRALELDFIKKA
jgi:hypothetical protein